MPYDVNLLKSRTQCLQAKASLEAELDGYQNRDQNEDFRDRQAGRASATASSRLATYTDRVKYLTEQLARPDLAAADRARYDDELLTATYQKARLTKRSVDTDGTATFLADVDADQLDAQVALLRGAIAAVQAHQDALPA